MKRLAATILTLTILGTGCSSGPTLTDAQTLWCTDNVFAVIDTSQRLELKSAADIWFEKRGAAFDTEGELAQTEKNEELAQEYIDLSFDRSDTLFSEWLEHPDGIRACIAAYDSR